MRGGARGTRDGRASLPACDRELEEVEIDPQKESPIESLMGDLSGSLGDRQNRDIETMVCPSCGLLGLDADLEFEP